MTRRVLWLALLVWALPLRAQVHDGHGLMEHGAGHGSTEQGGDHGADKSQHQPAHQPSSPADPHAGHAAQDLVPKGTPPAMPTDHAADAIYDPAEMKRARAAMIRENGGMAFSQLMIDRLEYRSGAGRDSYYWQGEGWMGGDIDRFAFKTEGEGDSERLERAEVQALYRRAIDPWFNLQAGMRHDFQRGPDRSYAAVGVEGLAPYWFDVGAHVFLSSKGDLHLRLEGSYDQRITQRLIVQPAAEIDFAAQDVPDLGVGSGLSDVELGLRLRYEFAREFAPYIGVNWSRKMGETARFARAAGDRPSSVSLVTGIRFWF